MNAIGSFIAVVIAGEVALHILLFLISRLIGKPNRDKISFVSILKGLLERTFIVIVLVLGLAAGLAVLGALKIATRIKDEESKVSNDFFLIGNLLSILFGIGYFLFYTKFIAA
jgi:hypothetical protein